MKTPDIFLREHELLASYIDINNLVEVFIGEMESGLQGKESSLRMIPTYIEAENEFLTGVSVLAIDAGGTNFRAALIRINRNGLIDIGDIVNYRIPGIEGEISASEFFATIADYVRPFASETQRIGFCFSYPTEILSNRDGRLIQFCKEVQAPDVVGKLIGKNLLEALGMPDKKIVLLNDTVATLLSGKSASTHKNYDSYIGYILGTGTNTCYTENNLNILKNKKLVQERSQIINIESGNFGKAPRTDLDILFDNTTVNPGHYTFEKMFSGGYFGGLCLTVLKTAAIEGVFTHTTASKISSITELSSFEANDFAIEVDSKENILAKCFTGKHDAQKCHYIINALIERSAKLVASNLAAVVLKTGKGINPEKPLLITIEGTTFYKLHNLKPLFEFYLNEHLSGDRKRYVEFTKVDHSSLVGAALAALID